MERKNLDEISLKESQLLISNALSINNISIESGLNLISEWDSLGHVKVLVALEKMYGIDINEESINNYTSVLKIAELIMLMKNSNMQEKEIQISSSDNLKTSGTLNRQYSTPKAVVIFVHGITSDRDEWGLFSEIAKQIANENITSFRFDYRGHGKSNGVETVDLSLTGIINDIANSYEALKSEFIDDISKIDVVVVGSSFGGGVGSLWGIKNPSIVKHIVLCAPVLSYSEDINNCSPNWEQQVNENGWFEYGPLKLGKKLLDEQNKFDIYSELSNSSIPVTIFHGAEDSDVPISSSKKLIEMNSSASLIEIPGADHGFCVPEDYDFEKEESKKLQKEVANKISSLIINKYKN